MPINMGIMTGDKKGFKKSDRCVCEGLYFLQYIQHWQQFMQHSFLLRMYENRSTCWSTGTKRI